MTEQTPRKRRDPVIFWTVVITTVLGALLLALVLWHVILSKRIERRLQAFRAKGYPTTLAAMNDWYPDVPEAENAAYDYLAAADSFVDDEKLYERDGVELPVVGEGDLPPRGEPLPPNLRDLIAAYLEANAKALKLLHTGATKTRCKYPVDLRAGYNVLLPHLARIRQGARLLRLEGILNADEEKPHEAVESVVASLHLGNSLSEEPILISNLVRIAVLSIARKNAEEILNRVALPDEDLVTLSREFAACEMTRPMQRAMVCETLLLLSVFEHPEVLASSFGGTSDTTASIALNLYSLAGFTKVEEAETLDIMRQQIEITDLPLERWMDAMQDLELEQRVQNMPRTHLISRMLLPALGSAYTREIQNIANLRAARTAFAVERYRLRNSKLPETLDALTPGFLDSVPLDPFDGKPLRYKKTDKGYVVYSVNMNMTDDGGIETDPNSPNSDPPDITFTVERTPGN